MLTAISALESSWGKSDLAKRKNNIFGLKTKKYFDTKTQCIDETASFLSQHYLSEDGKYFNGYTLEAINVRYCELRDWSMKIKELMKQIYTQTGVDING
jgi:uncharacterized FlgJ-related protein